MHVAHLIEDELVGLHWRLQFARMAAALLPVRVGARTRGLLLRLCGFRVGRGTVLLGMPEISGPKEHLYEHLVIGDRCMINAGCLFELGARLEIGNGVSLGHQVMLLTTTHAIGPAHFRCGPQERRSVRVGDGCWLGARSAVLPGVSIGEGAVVAAAAVVTRDVPPHSVVAGVPARVLRELERDESRTGVSCG